MDEKLLDKIQKLLALSTSPNVNEAAAAAAKAQELMTKHQIELADVQSVTPGAKLEPIQNEELFREKSHIPWKVQLAAAIAEANGCKAYVSVLKYVGSNKRAGQVTRFIGTTSSIATVRYMYAYLVKEVDRLAAANREGHDRAWLNSFRLGAVGVISTRLLQAAKQAKHGASTGALAVIDKDAERVKEAMAALDLKEGKAPSFSDRDGYVAGARAGNNVNLSSGPGLGAGARGELKDGK